MLTDRHRFALTAQVLGRGFQSAACDTWAGRSLGSKAGGNIILNEEACLKACLLHARAYTCLRGQDSNANGAFYSSEICCLNKISFFSTLTFGLRQVGKEINEQLGSMVMSNKLSLTLTLRPATSPLSGVLFFIIALCPSQTLPVAPLRFHRQFHSHAFHPVCACDIYDVRAQSQIHSPGAGVLLEMSATLEEGNRTCGWPMNLR